jgi:hypothetical protein
VTRDGILQPRVPSRWCTSTLSRSLMWRKAEPRRRGIALGGRVSQGGRRVGPRFNEALTLVNLPFMSVVHNAARTTAAAGSRGTRVSPTGSRVPAASPPGAKSPDVLRWARLAAGPALRAVLLLARAPWLEWCRWY